MLAGALLLVTLAASALLVGARAVAGAESTGQRLFLAALAVGGALYSAAKASGRSDEDAREGLTLRDASGGWRALGRSFMKTHGY
ncbi:MAG TPA: hypothetical protein VJ866_23440 [Pyrinomonadaceae bacterium]|nr:hypothetical protein [Pyrinomonadaceae bacterium]